MRVPVVVVHGGAGHVEPSRLDAHVAGCARAAKIGLDALLAGGSVIDAVQAAVEDLELDPLYNAGRGGSLSATGDLELDAAIMDGEALRAGAICVLPPYPHPIRIARELMDRGRHVMLGGEGAARFAESLGMTRDPSMITERAKERLAKLQAGQVGEGWAGGTVGAVASDGTHVAAATSTGGTVGAAPGRIGDSPILGAGTWADDLSGACSATGVGEPILRFGLARWVCERASGGAQRAAEDALAAMQSRVGGEAGLIVVTAGGDVGIARTTQTMSHAIARPEGVTPGH